MSVLRSKSVPASRTTEETSPKDEEGIKFPPLVPEPSSDQRVPIWIQELASARAGRHSRASSIVSTRTRFSTTTFDDARSIDIQAGGQTFRISRFGDRVTDTTAPPPYSGPIALENATQHSRTDQIRSTNFGVTNLDNHVARDGPTTHRQARRVRIAMPDDDDDVPPSDDDESIAADTPSRELSDEELRQIILDLPTRLKNALGIEVEHVENTVEGEPETRILSTQHSGKQHDTDVDSSTMSLTDDSIRAVNSGQNGQLRGILRNAPENASYQNESASTDHEEPLRTPPTDSAAQRLWNTYRNARLFSRPGTTCTQTNTAAVSLTETSDSFEPLTQKSLEDAVVAPTVGDLNELSQVYNKVIRDLDREHRKHLHARDKELDQLRILLHEKDIVYRQQLKGKDFIIEDLKTRLDRMEEVLETKVDRAVHEVEDLWESRWKEHNRELMEKCGLMKPAIQAYSTRGTQTEADDA